jgi:hypothetical protein
VHLVHVIPESLTIVVHILLFKVDGTIHVILQPCHDQVRGFSASHTPHAIGLYSILLGSFVAPIRQSIFRLLQMCINIKPWPRIFTPSKDLNWRHIGISYFVCGCWRGLSYVNLWRWSKISINHGMVAELEFLCKALNNNLKENLYFKFI